MSASKKELQKRMLIKQTMNAMNKQIDKLEEQKNVYIEAGKEAKKRGLQAQYNLALTGLKMTIEQQRRVYEMKLNFEITSQMKDMTVMTQEFLGGMSALSKDMLKLTNEKDFAKVQKQFTEAMTGAEMQAEQMQAFMDDTKSTFESGVTMSKKDSDELEKLLDNEAAMQTGVTDSEIEKELDELKKRMES